MNCYTTDLFKQTLYSFKLDLNLDELNNYCFNYASNNKSEKKTNLGGFQSSNIIGNEECIQNLTEKIFYTVNFVSKKYYNINKNLNISNLWFNINKNKDFNLEHTHPHSILSGVFYSKVPLNSGEIVFVSSENAHIYLNSNGKIEINYYNNLNSSTYSIVPEEGILHIFPSWLKHYVLPNVSNEERISFSFNTHLQVN